MVRGLVLFGGFGEFVVGGFGCSALDFSFFDAGLFGCGGWGLLVVSNVYPSTLPLPGFTAVPVPKNDLGADIGLLILSVRSACNSNPETPDSTLPEVEPTSHGATWSQGERRRKYSLGAAH